MKLFISALTKFLVGLLMVAALIFLPAGTLAYPGGLLFLCLLFVPMQKLFEEAEATAPYEGYWLWDGVHPTEAGHELIKRQWLKAFAQIKD